MAEGTNRKWGVSQPLGLAAGLSNGNAGNMSKSLWILCGVCMVLLVAMVGYLFCEHCGWLGPSAHTELQQVAHLINVPQASTADTLAAVQAYLQSVLGPAAVLAGTSSTAVLPPASAVAVTASRSPRAPPPAAPTIIVHDSVSKRFAAHQARGDGL